MPLSTDSALTAPPGLTLVAAEHVLLLAVAFPPMTAAQRRAAAPFAVEERIACPLEEVQVALVAPLEPQVQGAVQGVAQGAVQVWLVAVVAQAVLAELPAVRGQRLMPDVLCLPRPAPGEWSVAEAAGRMLVRLPDGTGLALQAEGLALAHRLSGAPGIVLYGGDIAASGLTPLRREILPDRPEPALNGFDLRAMQPRRAQVGLPRWRRIAAVAAVAGLGHVAIAGADVAALSVALQAQQAALAGIAPLAGLPASVSPAEVLAARNAAAAPAPGHAPVLPMIARAAGALAGVAGGVSLREMRFQRGDGTLVLVVQAPDLAGLQAVETALAGQGLAVEAGPAVNDAGLAEQTLTLREGPT